MRRAFLALAGACLLATRTPVHPLVPPPDPPESLLAAQQWLALLDAGRLAQAWDAAAPAFQAEQDRTAWLVRMRRERAPLGALRSRRLDHSRFGTALEGAPDAQYVAYAFSAAFDRRPLAVETLATLKLPDGSWRVRRYAIR